MKIEFLYWDECPSHPETLARLHEVLNESGLTVPVSRIHVETDDQAAALRFPGSPTIRVDGTDLFPVADEVVGLTCRVYYTPDGRSTPLPTKEMIRSAFQRRQTMVLALESKLLPFSLPGTDGKTHSSDHYRQARVLGVVFTCNHCPYAKAWEDRLIRLQRDFASSGVQLLLISSNDPAKIPDDSFENMTLRSKEKAYPFPYLFDESQEIARAYGATRTPEIFLFDAGRVLRYHGAPDDNYENPGAVTHHYARDAITALIAGRRPEPADTKAVGCTIKWKA